MNNKAVFRKSSLSLAIGLALSGQYVHAMCDTETVKNLVVTSVDDTIDDTDGVLTLREALNQAPANRDTCNNPDVITFSSALDGRILNTVNGWLGLGGGQNIVLTTQGNARITIKNANADQPLFSVEESSKATIENLVFDGEGVERNIVPLILINNSPGVTIKNSEVKNYRRPDSQAYLGPKGAISAASASSLQIEHTDFNDNIGGALSAENTPLTIIDSTFTNNQVNGNEGTSAYGGAVYFGAGNGETLTINKTAFTSNKIVPFGNGGHGGALYAIGSNVNVEINDSQFQSNQANDLTGIYTIHGGAVYISGANAQLEVDKSQFTSNTADAYGGAIYLDGGGCSMQMTNSALFSNTAGSYGGAIYATACSLNIIQSTISSNSASSGGGIANLNAGSISLTQSTVTLNTATTGGALYGYSEFSPTLDCDHSVIADNNLDDPTKIYGFFPTHTENYCYIDNNAMLGDQIGYVHIPKVGSPLIDAGDPNYVPYSDTDQRGDQRVRGSAIDIGAAESGNAAPIRAVADQPVIQLQPGVNEFDTTTELGITDDDGILIYSLQTVGNGLSITEDGLLTIDTTVDSAWTDNVTMDTDGLIVLELSDGFTLQEIEIKISGVDSDGDNIADHLDSDRDGDGVANNLDAFPDDPSESADSDDDGIGDNADAFPHDATETKDSDSDGVGDNADAFPHDATETVDSDGDGVGDNADAFPNNAAETADRDGDGVGDNADAFPNDATETVDSDGDGVGDNADAFPHDASETVDSDGDGVGDNTDAFPHDATEIVDSDGDGVGDSADAFPHDATEIVDSDGDGVGDNADAFPHDASETADSDGDGVGDNADAFPNDASETIDSDGDGVGDNSDAYPNDAARSTLENGNTTSDQTSGDAATNDQKSGGGGSTGILALLSLTLIRLMRRR